jgi:hypothetical protein
VNPLPKATWRVLVQRAHDHCDCPAPIRSPPAGSLPKSVSPGPNPPMPMAMVMAHRAGTPDLGDV